jgi:hypothetical protein
MPMVLATFFGVVRHVLQQRVQRHREPAARKAHERERQRGHPVRRDHEDQKQAEQTHAEPANRHESQFDLVA